MNSINGIPVFSGGSITSGTVLKEYQEIQNIDRCSGLTPTQTGWDTAPTNLTNITDGDYTTVCGTAIKTNVANNGNSGSIKIDMAASYDVLIVYKVLVGDDNRGAAGTLRLYIDISTDDATYYKTQPHMGSTSFWLNDTDAIIYGATHGYGRYIKAYVGNETGDVADLNLAFYVLKALDLGV